MVLSRRSLALLPRRWIAEAAVHLFPSHCFACERTLPRAQLLNACLECWASLSVGCPPRCERCALPLPEGAGRGPGATCLGCAVRPLPFDGAVAAVGYDDHARRFLLRAKNGHRPELLRALAGQLVAAVALSRLGRSVDAVISVPSTPWARLRRGFDPASVLAKELARGAGLRFIPAVLRKRTFAAPTSKALAASARWAAAIGSIRSRSALPGATVLLVDDVLTTGATAAACAAALRAAGASEIRVAVWARTPSPQALTGRGSGAYNRVFPDTV
jgi:predicted amidophosphoribosyltransferase